MSAASCWRGPTLLGLRIGKQKKVRGKAQKVVETFVVTGMGWRVDCDFALGGCLLTVTVPQELMRGRAKTEREQQAWQHIANDMEGSM